MTESPEIGTFIARVLETLHKNGFPEKKVSLPLETMYEKAYEKGFSFNKVLEFLKEKDILHEKTTDKIIFYAKPEEPIVPEDAPKRNIFEDAFKNFDPSLLKGGNMLQMLSQAREMMKNLSPEQIKEIQDMVMNMDPEKREELMKKAREAGLG